MKNLLIGYSKKAVHLAHRALFASSPFLLSSFLKHESYSMSPDICKRLSACCCSTVSQLEPGQVNAARKVSRPRVWTNSMERGQRKCCVTQTLEKEGDWRVGGGMTETLGTWACFISPIMTDGFFIRQQLQLLLEKLSKHDTIEEDWLR